MIRTVLLHEFVTGGGLAGEELPPSWAAEGRAMRRALAEDFAALDDVRVVMTLDARLPDEPGPWETARVGPGEEPATFARLAAACDWTLCVAPETGGVLEHRARDIERAGGRSLGCSPEAIALCADKLRLGERLAERGINTPTSIRVFPMREGLPREHPYPAVLKPIDGAGCMDTYLVESPDDPPPMVEALLQPFVAGRAMSAAFLVLPSADARVIGLADQVIGRVSGRFLYRGGVAPSAVKRFPGSTDRSTFAPMASVQSVPGLFGWVGVDFVWDVETGRSTVLEINPRVTTSYVGFRHAMGAEDRSWIASKWFGGIAEPGSIPPSPRRERLASWRPVAFSADGRVGFEGFLP